MTGPPETALLSLTSPSAVGPGRQVRGPSASPLLQLRPQQDGHSETGGTGECGGQSPHWAGKPTPKEGQDGCSHGTQCQPVLRRGQSPQTWGRGEPAPGGLGPGPSHRGHRDNALDSGNEPGAVAQRDAVGRASPIQAVLPHRLRTRAVCRGAAGAAGARPAPPWKGSCLPGPQPGHLCFSPGSASWQSGVTGLTSCSSAPL